MVKVAELLLAMVALAGVTTSQPLPLLVVAVGVMVTLPEQAPITPIVKVCAVGLKPAALENMMAVVDGACRVQGGCTFKVIDTTCGVPTAKWVTLSIAVIVTLPVYLPASRPFPAMPTVVTAVAVRLTVPAAGLKVSQVLPVG